MPQKLYKYRVFCQTENAFGTIWRNCVPTVCSNNISHTIDNNSITIVDQINNNNVKILDVNKDSLGTNTYVQPKSIIDLKSFHGLLKDNIYSTSGSGSVTSSSEVDSEIQLQVSTQNSTANIRSKKRGYYVAGYVSQCGIAIRIPQSLDTTQNLKFGYFDSNNGYYFKITSSDIFVCVLNNGVENAISRAYFNKLKLDGTEDNGITLNLSKGNIFRIDFTWYGYGNVCFSVIQTDNNLEQKIYPLHIYDYSGGTTCKNPNLPITVELTAGTSNVSKSIYIGGRQYSILGNVERSLRKCMYYVHNASGTLNGLQPLFSFRNKSNCKTFQTKIKKFTGKANTNAIIQIIENPTLNNPSYETNSLVDESCMEVDVNSTTVSGTIIRTFLVLENTIIDINTDYELYEDYTYSITWKPIVSNLSYNISLQLDWDEFY